MFRFFNRLRQIRRLSGLIDNDLVIEALEDAIEYRESGDYHSCADCTFDEMCEDHQGDQERADAYQRQLDVHIVLAVLSEKRR